MKGMRQAAEQAEKDMVREKEAGAANFQSVGGWGGDVLLRQKAPMQNKHPRIACHLGVSTYQGNPFWDSGFYFPAPAARFSRARGSLPDPLPGARSWVTARVAVSQVGKTRSMARNWFVPK